MLYHHLHSFYKISQKQSLKNTHTHTITPMKMALLSSSPTPTLTCKPINNLTHKPYLLNHNLNLLHLNKPRTKPSFSIRVSADNGAGVVVTTEEKAVETAPSDVKVEKTEESVGPTGDVAVGGTAASSAVKKFTDPKWVNGTWDLKQFIKGGSTDWDAVIDAEAKRRKWLETYPESTSNNEPILFDTSIIPWWAWIKRFHLPEAELLNGRAAMIGFFMSYFVDSLTGLGVVDQMNNFFCKTLLFIGVLGVLLIRKNEDVDNLKKLIEETTFYDKQWQATWQEENGAPTKKD